MKQTIINVCIASLLALCSYGQNSSSQQTFVQRVETYFVVDKTTLIQIDSLNTDFIKPKWIKKMEFLKDEKYINIYGNTGGKLLVYPKKRFKNTLKNELNKRILIDNLIQEIYRDTIRFDEKDLVFTQIGRRNINSYSMLYVVNGAYSYVLDIISSDKVVEFVNEILDADKIESIAIISKEKIVETMLDGIRAQNGIALIILKRNTKFNPLVAGFNLIGNSGGDNFSKRNENELMIRE